jgi:hypothetical protein
MMAAEVAMPIMLQRINTACAGQTAEIRKQTLPMATIRAALALVVQPAPVTKKTTTGDSNSPTLPPAATRALANGSAWKQRTAMRRRNVLPAVSIIPAVLARWSS